MPPNKLKELIELSETPSQRLIFVFRVGCFVVLALGTGWIFFFAYMGWWSLLLVELVLPMVSVVNLFLLRCRKLSLALYSTQIVFTIFITLYCLLFDLPIDNTPRSAHLFFPVLALLGYLNYQWRKTNFQIALIICNLLLFPIFNISDISLTFASPIPAEARPLVAWANNLLAIALICGTIYARQLQFFQIFGLAKDLRSAITKRELELFYQAQVDENGKINGAEALIRWRHPELGYVTPAHFIPLAEQNGLIHKVGGWVLAEACRTLGQWQQNPAMQHLKLSINVSTDQFLLKDFDKLVKNTLTVHGVPPERLTLELTESVMAKDADQMRRQMQKVKASGVSIALDDFGTGYSSLSYLRTLPIDILKIDRSFIINAQNISGASLVKHIVQIGLDLNLSVVAEGVETEDHFLFLQNCGCRNYQGYYFGKPMPQTEFERGLTS